MLFWRYIKTKTKKQQYHQQQQQARLSNSLFDLAPYVILS